MARRTFDVIDVTEILMHWHAGRSKNEMAESLGVDRKTLFNLAAVFDAATMSVGERTGQVVMSEAPAPGAGWPSN